MLIVRTPVGRDAMRHYVCDVVLGDWFGLAWRMEQHARRDVSICLDGSSFELRIPDLFFSMPESAWLKAESLPTLPLALWDGTVFKNDAAVAEQPLPVLYGTNSLCIKQDEEGLDLPLDLLGSIFFLLTGYEELVSTERDSHGRFPASASLAMRAGFIDRPLADEYANVLWLAMQKLWPQLKRRSIKSQLMLSCDVDQPFDCTVSTFSALFRACTGDVAKRRTPMAAMRRMLCFICNRIGDYRFDPCYTFDSYLELCKAFDLRATFYFIPSSSQPGNGCYSITEKSIQQLMRKLSDGGHEIGMHGCYEAYVDNALTQCHREQMIRALDQAGIQQPLKSNRQHYLRWDSKITPSVLDQAGFEFDSTGGFADRVGFRFGTAREFSMWDWLSNRQLKLRQRPLIVMDCSLIHPDYMGLAYGEAAENHVAKLIRQVKIYGGVFSVLWHNDSISKKNEVEFLESVISIWS